MGINSFDRSFAREAVSGLELKPTNRALADCWLTLWQGSDLPPGDCLGLERLKETFPNFMIVDVIPDQSATVRYAGAIFRDVLEIDLTGRDWIALAPASYRPKRLRYFSDIAGGAIGRGLRYVEIENGQDYVCEEVLLPFAPRGTGGVGSVLCHVDWDPHGRIRSPKQAMGPALAFEIVPLRPLEERIAIAG